MLKGTTIMTAAAALFLGSLTASAETLKLGYIGPVTGQVAEIGTQMMHAARLAVDEANAAGGVEIAGKTYTLELAVGDTEGLVAERAVSAQQRLHQLDGVLGSVGHAISSQVLAVLPIVQSAGVPMINSVGKASSIPQTIAQDKLSYVFQLSPTNDELAASHGAFLQHYFQPKRISFIGVNTDAARDYAERAKAQWSQIMPGLEMQVQYIEATRNDILPEMLQIQAFAPDAVYALFVGAQTYAFVDQFHASGLSSRMIVLGDSEYGSPDFPTRAGEKANLQFGNAVTFEGPITEKTLPFFDAYRKAHGAAPGYYAVQTYDAMLMLIEGLSRVPEITGDLAADRTALRDALETITPENPVVAARGELSFSSLEDGHRVQAEVAVVQFRDGRAELVWPMGPAASEPTDPRAKQ